MIVTELKHESATDVCAVSIILPTYNRAYCLRRSIDSVLRQTFADFELIVIDDGSTDDTEALVESYDDPRIVFLRHADNQGQTKRLNQGIRSARAPLIAFQDSDDEWLPEKLEKQVAAMRAAPPTVGVVYVDRWRIVDGGETTLSQAVHITPEDGLFFKTALNSGIFNTATQCLLVRRECFERVGGFEERIRQLNDLEMLMRLSKTYLFLHVPEPLVNYYVSSDSMSSGGEAVNIKSWEVIFEKYRADLRHNRPRLGQLAYWIGSFHMRTDDSDKGRRFLRTALQAQPFNARYLMANCLALLGVPVYRYVYRNRSGDETPAEAYTARSAQ